MARGLNLARAGVRQRAWQRRSGFPDSNSPKLETLRVGFPDSKSESLKLDTLGYPGNESRAGVARAAAAAAGPWLRTACATRLPPPLRCREY